MTLNQELIKQLSDQKYALDQAAIVAATDVRGAITYVNEKFCEVSGYSRAELMGKTHKILNSGYHDEDFFRNLWATISRGQTWRGEICNRKKNGEIYWVYTTIVPYLDEKGHPSQYMSIRYEITDLKKAQKLIEEQQVKLASASRLSAMGELAAAITHEINNPLGVILGRVEMLKSMLQDSQMDKEDFLKKLESIEVTGLRIAKIVRGMKTMAHHQEDEPPQKYLLRALIQEAADLCQYRIERKGIEFKMTSEEESMRVNVRSHQIVQVIVNLINNAVDAISSLEKKWIHIEVKRTSKNSVEILVSDSGSGIPEGIVKKMFDPFFSTKSVQYGTGLGLSISLSLIQKNSGELVYLTDRAHTTFSIRLPITS